MLAGKRWGKKSPIDVGLSISLVHKASLREPCLPAPSDAVGRYLSAISWLQTLGKLISTMQVGGYRPHFRPHRRVIETPGRNPCLFPAAFLVLAVSLVPAQDIHGALRS